MIEKISHKKKMYALIVRSKFRKKSGINFFTSKESTQQFGYMKHKKNYLIMPHKHNKRLTKILITTEVIILFKGILFRSKFKSEYCPPAMPECPEHSDISFTNFILILSSSLKLF